MGKTAEKELFWIALLVKKKKRKKKNSVGIPSVFAFWRQHATASRSWYLGKKSHHLFCVPFINLLRSSFLRKLREDHLRAFEVAAAYGQGTSVLPSCVRAFRE